MNRSLAFLAAVVVGIVAAPASAVPIVDPGDILTLTDSYGTTGGGEFIADLLGEGDSSDFITFCLEKNEFFTSGQQLKVAGVTTAALNGGVAGGNPDPLDARTAYLYTHFMLGTLGGYAYTSTGSSRVADANSLQKTIWYIENEITSLGSDAQAIAWYNEATSAVSGGQWSGVGNVRVLNLMRKDSAGQYTVKAQDQLYLLAPEPSSLLLLGAGLAALAVLRRR